MSINLTIYLRCCEPLPQEDLANFSSLFESSVARPPQATTDDRGFSSPPILGCMPLLLYALCAPKLIRLFVQLSVIHSALGT
jgi:hypothetical protein